MTTAAAPVEIAGLDKKAFRPAPVLVLLVVTVVAWVVAQAAFLRRDVH